MDPRRAGEPFRGCREGSGVGHGSEPVPREEPDVLGSTGNPRIAAVPHLGLSGGGGGVSLSHPSESLAPAEVCFSPFAVKGVGLFSP